MRNLIRLISCAALLLACAAVREARASGISAWVQATSSACICNGLPWDVGSSANSGQLSQGFVSETSGPFTDNYPGSNGSQYADGWSSADDLGTLKAFSQVDATVPIPEVQADGHSYWGATLLATCAPPASCPGGVTFDAAIELHDTLVAGNYGQYGGGSFVNYTGAGEIATLFIHDAADQPAATLTLDYQFTVPVGTYFDIGADLTAQTQAQEGFATADASSTGLFALDVLTPGGGYVGSGAPFATSFSTGAPEPGTTAMAALGCGMLLVGFVRRGRK